MPRLSIIIPALGQTTLLEEGLVSVLQHRPADSEVIVLLSEPYEDPYNLRDEDVRFVDCGADAAWLSALNRGLAVAAGDIVHPLACGAAVHDGWADHALQHFDHPQIAAVAPLVLDAAREDRVLTAGVSFSPAGSVGQLAGGKRRDLITDTAQASLGPSIVAGFYRSEALTQIGSALDAALGPELADVDLALRLRQAGYEAVLEPASQVVVSAEALPCEPHGRERSRHAEHLYWRHLPPQRRVGSLIQHGLALIGETVLGLTRGRMLEQWRGRFAGVVDAVRERFGRVKLPAQPVETSRSGLPASVRIDAAHRPARKRAPVTERPLRRSA